MPEIEAMTGMLGRKISRPKKLSKVLRYKNKYNLDLQERRPFMCSCTTLHLCVCLYVVQNYMYHFAIAYY